MSKKILLPNGCTCGTPSVNPKNWKTCTKSALLKDWYVSYYFYDPEYPKPKLVLIKGMNHYKDVEGRRNATKFIIQNELNSLVNLGFNPHTKKYSNEPEKPKGELHSDLFFIDALEIVFKKIVVQHCTILDVRSVLKYLTISTKQLRFDYKIKDVHSGIIRDLLDNLKLSNNRFNKYLTYLSILFSELTELRVINHNPIRDIRKRKVVKKIRETFTISELKQIFDYLQTEHYTFYRYGMIFFHTGARTTELFTLKKSEVYIERQEYKLTILKGNNYKEVIKVILPNVLPLWHELLSKCENDSYYLFGAGLEPSETAIQSYQITKRFKRLIKDKFVFKNGILTLKSELAKNDNNYKNITADFYSLKHLFLDELDKHSNSSLDLSKNLASHTTNITETAYLFGRESRKNEVLKNININIFAL